MNAAHPSPRTSAARPPTVELSLAVDFRRWRAWLTAGLSLALLTLAWARLTDTLEAQTTATEEQLKAAVIYSIAKYVEWPTSMLATATAPLRFGIVGHSRLVDALEETIGQRKIGAHPLAVLRVEKETPPTGCAVLFFESASLPSQLALLEKLRAEPVLTMGENEDFLRQGGVVPSVQERQPHRVSGEPGSGSGEALGHQRAPPQTIGPGGGKTIDPRQSPA